MAAGPVCVFLHVVVDTVFDRTSSDYTEVQAMCPNEAMVKHYKYTSALRPRLCSHRRSLC